MKLRDIVLAGGASAGVHPMTLAVSKQVLSAAELA